MRCGHNIVHRLCLLTLIIPHYPTISATLLTSLKALAIINITIIVHFIAVMNFRSGAFILSVLVRQTL